jgi:glycosyltransferase involved in cell wall biosynthesis
VKILFDNEIFHLQKYGGVSRYFSEIIKGINTNNFAQAYLPSFYSTNAYLPKTFLNTFEAIKPIHNLLQRTNSFFNSLALRSKYDLVHLTHYNSHSASLLKKKPFVITIHDMTPEVHGTFDPAKKELAYQSAKVIAVSHHTKKDILKFYDLDPNKIQVVHHGCSLQDIEAIPHPNLRFTNFILYLGSRGEIKNFTRFVTAAANTIKNTNIGVVCSGGPSFDHKEKQLFADLGIEEKIKHLTVSDKNLKYLYENALCFVFPSLYEGFGIPILEAFASACPVALHNGSCFPEIAENAALYFDGKSVPSIEKTIKALILSPEKRNIFIKKGKQQLEKFSWKKAAKETTLTYESILYGRKT